MYAAFDRIYKHGTDIDCNRGRFSLHPFSASCTRAPECMNLGSPDHNYQRDRGRKYSNRFEHGTTTRMRSLLGGLDYKACQQTITSAFLQNPSRIIHEAKQPRHGFLGCHVFRVVTLSHLSRKNCGANRYFSIGFLFSFFK
ncbi:hypothetical protein TWF730_010158 [Orbilia blumenaviensis]|uniref:Uncharacterized protein n=1 Tax=Orbilia blumenaviensis TaxID=1796055 RepID=A0AAV9UNG0_9PEZI